MSRTSNTIVRAALPKLTFRLPASAHTTLTVVRGHIFWAAAWWHQCKCKPRKGSWEFHCVAYMLGDDNTWHRNVMVTINSSQADIILAPPHPDAQAT